MLTRNGLAGTRFGFGEGRFEDKRTILPDSRSMARPRRISATPDSSASSGHFAALIKYCDAGPKGREIAYRDTISAKAWLMSRRPCHGESTARMALSTPIKPAPDTGKLAALNSISITGVNVFGLYPAGAGADLEVRSFAPGDGIPEDPVCGSGNGCVAALVRRDDILKKSSYHASQGRCVGRDGRIAIEFDNDTIWLGGHAVTCVEGWLNC